jgi:hypothetical protein
VSRLGSVYWRTTLHRYLNFTPLLGDPLRDHPCPILKRMDFCRNRGSGRCTFLKTLQSFPVVEPGWIGDGYGIEGKSNQEHSETAIEVPWVGALKTTLATNVLGPNNDGKSALERGGSKRVINCREPNETGGSRSIGPKCITGECLKTGVLKPL